MIAAGAVLAGALVSAGLLIPFGLWRAAAPADPIATQQVRRAVERAHEWRGHMALALDRAGSRKSPQQAASVAAAVCCALTVGGCWLAGPAVGAIGLVGGVVVCAAWLGAAAERQRRRLEAELVPLLELFSLELSGGGGILTALGSVTMQVEGPLAANLRGMLVASQVGGSTTFETRLSAYGERMRMPALGSLATILAASREYGTGTIQGVRALATDLRRAQRRQLIERSRKALNHVLLPAAFGVLLPFLGILMFPAVTVLLRSLR